MDDDNDLEELIDTQIEQQGVACMRATDGHVFVFKPETLRKLLAEAESKGAAIVFVKRGAES